MLTTKTSRHVELWPDETSSGRLDSPWIVSIETEDTSTTKYTDYDYGVAKALAMDLATDLGLKVVIRNRFNQTRTDILGPEGFYVEATPEESTRDIETIRRENDEAAERARAEEARLAALPDSDRTIILGGDD